MTTQYATAPKKSHTLRNVLLAVAFGFVLLVGGCFAVVGMAANEVGQAMEENSNKPGGDSNPLEIKQGEAFEVDGFNYAAGWKIANTYGAAEIKDLKVTNNRDGSDSALVEIKAWRGQEVLMVIDCTTEPIQPGTTTKLNCISGDKLPANYDRLTINDTF